MIKEAVILAGGKGTRLQSVVNDVPKPLADVAGKPFLEYLLEQTINFGIRRIVISVGYKAEKIINRIGNSFKNVEIVYAVENQPLGTGGGLRLALTHCITDTILVLNGDTYFGFSLQKLDFFQNYYNSSFIMALREINNDGRFGGVDINDENTIINFSPKQTKGKCLINAGVYLLNKAYYLSKTEDKAFSIEEDFFSTLLQNTTFKGIQCNGYFIDIGIPDDYHKANNEYQKFNQFPTVLFLDRDGVINKKIDDDYVRNPNQFLFEEGAVESITKLGSLFQKIVIVTNQRGVGRGLMSKSDLEDIHSYLKRSIEDSNGRIDGIYCCIHDYKDNCQCRKPLTGLFEQIQTDYPFIRPENCIMVGDSVSDLEFGRNIGTKNIYIKHGNLPPHPSLWDETYDSLYQFKNHFILG